MNKTLSTFLAIALFLILPLAIWVWLHNAMVGKEEAVFEAWAQTESNLQRRADLVPALVETVSRYLRHETQTLESVTAARGQAAEQLGSAIDELIRVDKEMSDRLRGLSRKALEEESALGALFAAQNRVARGITGVLAVVEDYPELRSADQFLELQAQLEGTENRINVARIRFNEAVADYNASIRRLPGTLVASVGGFRRKAYFRSEEEARDAPELAFE
jgi:LemA protein